MNLVQTVKQSLNAVYIHGLMLVIRDETKAMQGITIASLVKIKFYFKLYYFLMGIYIYIYQY
jgi:hypothetical protein